MSGEGSLELVHSLSLPRGEDGAAGLLYAVVRDESGNLYGSDEYDHAVLSIDPGGAVRWRLDRADAAGTSFRYPKGLAIGSIRVGSGTVRCLAVCDSWNRCARFFSLDGRPVAVWRSAGGLDFAEVADVRYIAAWRAWDRPWAPDAGGRSEAVSRNEGRPHSDPAAEPTHACWLVLDRGNHRLCAFDVEGHDLFQVGRSFPLDVEHAWAARLLAEWQAGVSASGGKADTYDPLYQPTRILGCSPDALYLWESFSGRVKQVMLGSLFVVPTAPPQWGEWIAADDNGMVRWDAGAHRLSLHSCDGLEMAACAVEGRPVASDLTSNEIWLQNDTRLDRCRWRAATRPGAPSGTGRPLGPFGRSLERRLRLLGEDPALAAAVGHLAGCARDSLDLGYRALESARSPERVFGAWADETPSLLARVTEAACALRLATRPIPELALAGWCLRAAGAQGGQRPAPATLRVGCARLVNPIYEAFRDVQQCADDLHMLRSQPDPAGQSAPDSAGDRMALCQSHLETVNQQLQPWSDYLEAAGFVTEEPCARGPDGAATSGFRTAGPPFTPATRPPSLKEIDRLRVTPAGRSEPSCPYGIARTPEGNLFITLTAANCLVRLDRMGRVVDYVAPEDGSLYQPLGVTVDELGRVWAAEYLRHRLCIYDPRSSSFRFSSNLPEPIGPLYYPHGVCSEPGGAVLVADTGNNRIIRVSCDGKASVLGRGEGTAAGQFRHPLAAFVAADGVDDPIWVVDHRNHRLQNLNRRGEFRRMLGRCDCGIGSLLLPESACSLASGWIAVSECRLRRRIKVFDPDGAEAMKLEVDYRPGGVAEHDGHLLVTEAGGDFVRAYALA